VSTPHRGSPYADWCLQHLGHRLGGLGLMHFIGLDVQALADLTTEECRRFNERVPDAPQVRYYSVGGSRPWNRVPPFALHSYKVIRDAEGANDCLVSVKSSKWGKHLGVWPADHFHQLNKRMIFELIEPTGNITPYYLKLLDAIEADGVEMGVESAKCKVQNSECRVKIED
jgi:triacylglycerol lipase